MASSIEWCASRASSSEASESSVVAVFTVLQSADQALGDVINELRSLELGGEAGSSELRDWAGLELEGYRDVELPEYRRVPAVIQLDGVTMTHAIRGQQIGPHHFPADIRDTIREEQPFGHAIGEIESMLAQGKANGGFIKLAPPESQLLVSMLNHENSQYGIEGQQVTTV